MMLPVRECNAQNCPGKGATYSLRCMFKPRELEDVEVKQLLHTKEDVQAVVMKPSSELVTVSWKEIEIELATLAQTEQARLSSRTSHQTAEDQVQANARRQELLKLRKAIEYECEVARKTEEIRERALAQARATSSSIALPQRVPQYLPISMRYGEGPEGSDNIITYAALPLENPGAAEFGSTEGVEILQMLTVDRDIIAKVTIQPHPEPITVTWNGMWAEIALIANRQRQRQESADPEAHRADRFKDDERVLTLLKVREAIRRECIRRQQGYPVICSNAAAADQQESFRKLLGKKD